ncbi:MAG: single-stranded DNA-binding protein [Planctomycetes bacterium]|nr:single-stranded DNA-binding protein [Planctomycetota bacterium]
MDNRLETHVVGLVKGVDVKEFDNGGGKRVTMNVKPSVLSYNDDGEPGVNAAWMKVPVEGDFQKAVLKVVREGQTVEVKGELSVNKYTTKAGQNGFNLNVSPSYIGTVAKDAKASVSILEQ